VPFYQASQRIIQYRPIKRPFQVAYHRAIQGSAPAFIFMFEPEQPLTNRCLDFSLLHGDCDPFRKSRVYLKSNYGVRHLRAKLLYNVTIMEENCDFVNALTRS
jgi:hypothetical protein